MSPAPVLSDFLQGEANEGNPEDYSCAISAMVSDWRTKWYDATGGNTDENFSFGQVQVRYEDVSTFCVGMYVQRPSHGQSALRTKEWASLILPRIDHPCLLPNTLNMQRDKIF